MIDMSYRDLSEKLRTHWKFHLSILMIGIIIGLFAYRYLNILQNWFIKNAKINPSNFWDMMQAVGALLGSTLGIFGAYFVARFQIRKTHEIEIQKARPVFNIAIGKFVKNNEWTFFSTDMNKQNLKPEARAGFNPAYELLKQYESFFQNEDDVLCINLLTKDRILDVSITSDLYIESNRFTHNFSKYTYMIPDRALCFFVPSALQFLKISGHVVKCIVRISFTTLQRESLIYEYELQTSNKNSFLLNVLEPIKKDTLTSKNAIQEDSIPLYVVMDLNRSNAFFIQLLNYFTDVKGHLSSSAQMVSEIGLVSVIKAEGIAEISNKNTEFDKFKRTFFQSDLSQIPQYNDLLNNLSINMSKQEIFIKYLDDMIALLSSKVVDI
ncbi:hypothetical protein [Oenococcus sicerae]|uniref:Uncharacterized protein n=1 Tax=Oenococcus sicerae TaxID=2203724 RepID=A0AAJ1RBD3_9LACO|nr:hypothetical protein [Oenococcus sicerae]MDN6900665.1 hypothetical protein [Oenococcus sicerae]